MIIIMNVHLICNAHLDPAWLWELEEGVAEALATFRIAADLCEQFEGFVFNHNEALLYQWVEEHDNALFSRIQRLVTQGKWHIMGGWFLQPDCNMPSGESMIRQVEEGRRYFASRFDAVPTTAINFDPFGHSRGLVQILAGCGYDSYIITRPSPHFTELPDDFVQWVGYDGSQIMVIRRRGYNSMLGEAVKHIENHLERMSFRPVLPVLWGIGNHGGGPSRIDLQQIADYQKIQNSSDLHILHSTPEQLVLDMTSHAKNHPLPHWEQDLNPWAPGCYTSQVRIKQKHRALENLLYSIERMASHMDLLGLAAYPNEELASAGRDLMIAQFHDILPGSSIRAVEEAGIRLLDHGLEILVAVRTRLFLKLLNYIRKPLGDCIPIFAYNFQPYPVESIFACEFQPANQNWNTTFTTYTMVGDDGCELDAQIEHEASSLNLDWRKKIVFRTILPAMSMSCFRCYPILLPSKPARQIRVQDGMINLQGDRLTVVINATTGLVDRCSCDDIELLAPKAFSIVVVADNEDPWGSDRVSFPGKIGMFTLMEAVDAAAFSGLHGIALDAVRIIEDGPVQTKVEALFSYNRSIAIITYSVPKKGMQFDIDVQLHWLEPNCMAKLCIPAAGEACKAFGQVMFGREPFPKDGREAITQKWQAVQDPKNGNGFALFDRGIYGSDWTDGILRVSLLHSPVYSALPIGDRPVVLQDRHHQRIDFGDRSFSMRFVACTNEQTWQHLERYALAFNETPYLLSCFPTYGDDERMLSPGFEIIGDSVVGSSIRKRPEGGYLVRLFNSATESTSCRLVCEMLKVDEMFEIKGLGVSTLFVDTDGTVRQTDMLGR